MGKALLTIDGVDIPLGGTVRIKLPMVKLYTDTNMSMPVFVKRGKRTGPTLFISAAIHGDELNGIEIISRIIQSKYLENLKGTLIAVPIVNGYGVLNQSRYLPDRRDLNRSFPGSKRGSLAGRVADRFLNEIVAKADYGIDLHTGSLHRTNLPQVRANLDDPEILAIAKAFGVPVVLNSNLRDGSLRECAEDVGAKVILYEAGEALRFDELSIRAGVKGIVGVMRHLGMLPKSRSKKSLSEPRIARSSSWIRATDSGFTTHIKELGDLVEEGDVLAEIKDPYGDILDQVLCKNGGIIIGKQNIPLVQEGEAMYHIAHFLAPDEVAGYVESMQDELMDSGASSDLIDYK
ncbi:succinylglutamate desuccinylase/aspartoacylase family protein [Marinomonas sp. M1K-6]|uniref:Succinylglutamate desuccinylase/aspartoacylase family protein n=1 Tax=Marinomonas profundi TaxID=2726122 RepID=A0A847R097_9GAMM|nr:succinylglutamate desuccinylase/aspartoacylase family protein [Marinomonas profundi]NLQ16835.1 succinylglutamate desuccinylase/aspartoacylase family protein [Marinomonas profundi]UDV02566.1 succinylglutamate desuccinylase/aspartoacylase family protein [Marinomonas profundi]